MKNLTSFPEIVCLGVFKRSLTTCSDSNVIKQNPFLWFLVLSNGISTSTIYKIIEAGKKTINKCLPKCLIEHNKLTLPYCAKYDLISSSLISLLKPPTNILPYLALAFFGSTFLLLITWSPEAITLSIDSDDLKTIKANPLDLPVFGSVLTLILSISPYVLKCSRSSSVKQK